MTNWTTLLLLAGVELKDEVTFGEIVEQLKRAENQTYFEKLLEMVGIHDMNQTIKATACPPLSQWIQALFALHERSRELYPSEDIIFQEMDVTMLGLVRELHRHGIDTFESCNGNSRRTAFIRFLSEEDARKAQRLLVQIGFRWSRSARDKVMMLPIGEYSLFYLTWALANYRQGKANSTFEEVKKQARLELLESLLSIPGATGSEHLVREYLIQQLTPWVDKLYTDEAGNLHVEVKGHRDAKVLLSSHMDVVYQDIDAELPIMKIGPVWTRRYGILGADDRAGITLIVSTIRETFRRELPDLHIVFTVGEETGQYGAEAIDEAVFEGVDFALSCDRRGSGDIVTSCGSMEYGSQKFGELLEKYANQRHHVNQRLGNEARRITRGNEKDYRVCSGGISDLRVWSAYGINSANLSVGYYEEHTDHEYLNIDEWMHALEVVQKLLKNSDRIREELELA